MVSAFSICFLVGVVGIVSSQPSLHAYPSALTEEVPVSDRRTLGHIKPIKRIPVIKKHKKFGGWFPHTKTEFTTVPVQEVHQPPFFKIHRYHGIDLKPLDDSISPLSLSPLEFYPKSHSYFPLSPPDFTYFSNLPSKPAFYDISSLPKDEPIIEQFSSPLPIKNTISSVPSISPSVVVTPFPTSSPVTFFKHPESKKQIEPLFPSISLPPLHSLPVSSFPLVQPLTVKFAPSLNLPSSAPLFQPPISLPQISAPAPILQSFPLKDSFPTPNFEIQPVSTPNVASPAINLPSPTTLEPEFPYPPSNTPIPSHIKDISLTDHLPKIPQSASEMSVIEKDTTKVAAPVLSTTKPDSGLLNKFKGWKTQAANAALNHLNKFNKFQHSIAATHSTEGDKTPSVNLVSSLPNSHFPVFPSFPFQAPSLSEQKPSQGYTSLPHQNPLPPIHYEHFPPNSELTPPLFNSYGVPIPHDSYAPPRQSSHDRVSPAASEEKVSVLPPPPNFTEETPNHSSLNNEKNQGSDEPQISQSTLEFQTKNFRQFKPSSEVIFKERPVYVSDNKEIFQEGNEEIEEFSQLQHNINLEESNSDEKEQNVENLSNHREE